MNKNTPAPAGKKPDTDTPFEEPGQDESGKTSAPQSPQGPQKKPRASKDNSGDDDAAEKS